MRINLILARASNGVIGLNNQLPWHLPEDLAHFKRLTGTSPVVMGRKTWESLPARFRPLPGRLNIVVTRQADWQGEGAQRADSIQDALRLCPADGDIWVIGGAEVYAQTLPLARTAVVTDIEASFEGDAYAPQFGPDWVETRRERHTSATGLAFSFVTYQHQNPQEI